MRVGIIGCGLVGQKRAYQLAGQQLAWVCDTDYAKADKLMREHPDHPGTFYRWEDMLIGNAVDTVVVSTTHDQLCRIATMAVRLGKNVLIEKPVGKTSTEVKNLKEFVRGLNGRVRVGFNHRYHPGVALAHTIATDGSIGDLMHLRARYGHGGREGYDKEWRADPKLAAGGELVEQGIHIIDLASWFLGEFTEVSGFAATEFWDQELDDNAYLTLRTRTKQTAFMHVSCTEWKNTFSLEVFGTKGKVEVSGLGGSYGIEKCTLYHRPWNDAMNKYAFGYPETKSWEFPGPDLSWGVEFADFVVDIEKNREPSASLEHAADAWKVIDSIYKNTKET